MSLEVRVVSVDTGRLRLLEEQALLKRKEVVQLRGVVQRLRSRYELELNMDRSKTDFHDATALVHRLRTEILTSLGRDTVDDQCLKVITTNEAEYFWSFVDGVLSTSERKDVASSSASPSDPPEADISASELTVLLIEQSLKLDELAGNLHTGVAERHLRNQCKQLCHLARSL
ncbi:hypothetical protein C8R41DRAFT_919930 [Lentinula lateritia]|uniref:Uncharacterized protein n=1 Tax=Lentinula lateritia TaxID=40482 RepID=A0ABQ8VFF9_9AGAR|nr:hypothetical protein C8R41DRAFT_919930 [Lentinula lateritia]